jgi:hypothetical protein
MISQLQTVPSRTTVKVSQSSAFMPSWDRFVQVGLTLCLLPVLLTILLVGSIGMVVLAAAQFVPTIEDGPSSHPGNRAGLESLRS